eukprot:TRINITY_DN59728_c0_g1_i1.p1 TRINITY_DN59728_c0_g1~~TRINITY_DN59728_c0_g1_i1.p1  ORF type:complete len:410 (+),score=40.37 TRINITY_DN59728_c0_g1_i1:22-1251(+)
MFVRRCISRNLRGLFQSRDKFRSVCFASSPRGNEVPFHLSDPANVEGYVQELLEFTEEAEIMCEQNPRVCDGPLLLPKTDFDNMFDSLEKLKKQVQEQPGEATEAKVLQEVYSLAETTGEIFQAALFNWHHWTFYPLYDFLRPSERRYVELFCKHWGSDHHQYYFTDWKQKYRFSTYSYSHRIKGTTTNSSRFFVGVTNPQPQVAEAALTVMKERNIDAAQLMANPTLSFHSIGWDLEAGHFKLYLHVDDLSQLPEEFKSYIPDKTNPQLTMKNKIYDEMWKDLQHRDDALRNYGLLSFTWKSNNSSTVPSLHEKKLYTYVEDSVASSLVGVPEGVDYICLMTTNGDRGVVPQWDVSHLSQDPWDSVEWLPKISPLGKWIYDKYYSVGTHLDTIAWDSNANYTLYFPWE